MPDVACIHCNDTKKIMHGGEIPCPWCAPDGDRSLRGSDEAGGKLPEK